MTKKVFTSPLPDTPFAFGLAVRWVAEANRGFPIPKYDTSKFWRQGSIRGGQPSLKAVDKFVSFHDCVNVEKDNFA